MFFKRILDVVVSFIAILILIPLMALIAMLVKIRIGSPVLFKQHRPGHKEKIFLLYKFRTMTNDTNQKGELLPDNERLTKFGSFLRSTSLDELTSLFNILKGDMSFVGPRPLLVEYLNIYNDDQRKRHNAKPGLTGKAQVNGRNLLSWKDKFELDVSYVENITFMNDFLIFFKTIFKVISRTGISSENSATMEKFNISDNE